MGTLSEGGSRYLVGVVNTLSVGCVKWVPGPYEDGWVPSPRGGEVGNWSACVGGYMVCVWV